MQMNTFFIPVFHLYTAQIANMFSPCFLLYLDKEKLPEIIQLYFTTLTCTMKRLRHLHYLILIIHLWIAFGQMEVSSLQNLL